MPEAYLFSYPGYRSGLARFQQFEELVKLGKDDNPCTAVGGFSFVGIVRCYRVVLGPAGGSHLGGIKTVLLLQQAYDRRCAFCTQVPVVQQQAPGEGNIIRVAFYHELDVRLVFQYGCHFAEYLLGPVGHIIAAAFEQQFI